MSRTTSAAINPICLSAIQDNSRKQHLRSISINGEFSNDRA